MSDIQPLQKDVMERSRLYVDNLIKPLHSLGQLEEIAIRLAGITGEVKPGALKKALVVIAGDTAVDGENITGGKKSLQELTAVAKGLAPVNAAARDLGVPVYVADAGLQLDTAHIEGVLVKKVVHGTHRGQPAMTEDAAKEAISLGMSMAHSLALDGIQVVGLGNIGERSMLSALAVTTAVLKEDLAGSAKDKGLSFEWQEVGNIKDEPIQVLSRVGSSEIAALFGFVVQAAKERMAIVFDNAVTGAAVLAAVTVYPECKDYIFPSVYYDEPVHQMQMQKLGMKAFLHYDFTLGEGFGSAMGLSVIDASLSMINVMKTFGEGGVDVAEDGPGKNRQREDVRL